MPPEPAQRRRPSPTPPGRGRPGRPEPLPTVVYGRVARIEAAYPREVRVATPALTLVLVAATIATALVALIRAPFGGARRARGQRGWKDLRKGPEFLVTPVLVTDARDRLVPLEVHGHMSASALARGDRIRVHVRRSRNPGEPARAVRIENLTTGRTLTPRGATLWTHLGLGLLLQAMLGLVLISLMLLILFR